MWKQKSLKVVMLAATLHRGDAGARYMQQGYTHSSQFKEWCQTASPHDNLNKPHEGTPNIVVSHLLFLNYFKDSKNADDQFQTARMFQCIF
ncbi:hypothetical protein BC830DRAFT_1158767 [Chytriomyces sp. MP71]|nr:hypothetical protein BC830DRAFT_1158767 [Chytriomyces sp. MP71]